MFDPGLVISFINGLECEITDPLESHTSLIQSGLLDSLALFDLSVWIEEQVGRPIDPGEIDIAELWDNPRAIAHFIDAGMDERDVSEGAYEIVRYRPDNAAGVARLHSFFSPTRNSEKAVRFLDWKYRRNPYFSEPIIYLAIANGEPVAMRGFFGSLWESGGTRFLVPCAADLVVDPAHRGRGLIAKLMGVAIDELTNEGHPYVFSLSAGGVTTIGAFTMGFKRVARVEEHVRVNRWRLVFGRRVRRRHRFARFDTWAASAKIDRMLSASAEPRAEAMATLIERLGYDGRLRHVRDATYLNWRYRNPNSEFRFIYSGGGAIDGYIALAASRERANEPVYVLDWEGTSLDVKRELLDTALRFGGVPLLSVWAFGCTGAERELLAERGFVPTERPGVKGDYFSVLVKPLDSGTDPVGTAALDGTRWDYRMLYSDVC